MQFKEFKENVIKWSKDRQIIPNSTSSAQFGKTLEEIAELWQAIVSGDDKEIMDAVGDIAVTLINVDYLVAMENGDLKGYLPDEFCMVDGIDWKDDMRRLLKMVSFYTTMPDFAEKAMEELYGIPGHFGLHFSDCLQSAWDEIKDRTGTMGEDGVFIKNKAVANK